MNHYKLFNKPQSNIWGWRPQMNKRLLSVYKLMIEDHVVQVLLDVAVQPLQRDDEMI